MKNLLNIYLESSYKIEARIHFLSHQLSLLKSQGLSDSTQALELSDRIRLLYKEHDEISDIVSTLQSYINWRDNYAQKNSH